MNIREEIMQKLYEMMSTESGVHDEVYEASDRLEEIRQYKSCILLILKSVWKSNDVKMWKGLYSFIKHYV